MSNEPGWNAQRPGQHRQPQQPQPPQSPSRPPPQPPPNPPQPPQPPPPPPPHPNPPQQGRQYYGTPPPGTPPPGNFPSPVPPPERPAPQPSSRSGSADERQGGLAPNIAALLAYLFGWIGGLIIYLTQKDREVRFHAAQSILTFGGLAVLIVLLSILNIGGSAFVTTIILLLYLLSFGLWIFLSLQGYQLKHIKLPMIGDIAERWAVQ